MKMKNEKLKEIALSAIGVKNGSARCYRACEIVNYDQLALVASDRVRSDVHYEGISDVDLVVVWDRRGNSKYRQGAPLSSFLNVRNFNGLSVGVMGTSLWTADLVIFADGELLAVVSTAAKG